jgi:hypothetical protein
MGNYMSIIDHINRPLPSRQIRRPDNKRKRREPDTGKGQPDKENTTGEHKSTGDDHRVDELA